MFRCFARWVAALCISAIPAARGAELPVYIEESHAGSFYFLATRLNLEEPCTLLHFDAHSDASSVTSSDKIREAIRRVPDKEGRAKKFQQWRERGVIQCFDWIESLMPSPIGEVVWIPRRSLPEKERQAMEEKARSQIDGLEEAEPRAGGSFASRYHVADFLTWKKEAPAWRDNKSVVASIDLDYFASHAPADAARELEEILNEILSLRGLKALTFSLSSPYQQSRADAERLLTLALRAVFRIANARVFFEPFARTGPDKSLQALLMQRQGKEIPALKLDDLGPEFRSLLLNNWDASSVEFSPELAEDFLSKSRADPFLPRLTMTQRGQRALPDFDGIYRATAGDEFQISVTPPPVGARVNWKLRRAKQKRYHVADAMLGFAHGTPRWIFQEEVNVAQSKPVLTSADLGPFLDKSLGCGTLNLFAEVECDGQIRQSDTLTLCVAGAGRKGLKAAWSEQFGLPYVFGSTFLRDGFLTGPEARHGADCANFLIAGFRREGWNIPWGDPRTLTNFLHECAPSPQAGLIASFGTHIAGFWEDREPLGLLGDEDLFVHHLEGLPETIRWGKLKKSRASPKFYRLDEARECIRIVIVGDVQLDGAPGKAIVEGKEPLAGVPELFTGADAVLGNLECVITDQPAPLSKKSYRFRAPPGSADHLKKAGFTALSLANNHALDFGANGLRDTKAALDKAGIIYGGTTTDPIWLEIKGKRLAVFAIDAAETDIPELVDLSEATMLERAIREIRPKADFILVLPHWGTENSRHVSPEQRSLARRWLQAGADVVAGSGPHVLQEMEHLPHGTANYSLGNFIFAAPTAPAAWNQSCLLDLWIDAKSSRLLRTRLQPLEIQAGVPQAQLQD